jgi:putative redox protein
VPNELNVHAVHNGGMRFKATAGEHAITLDYPLPAGAATAGMTPLQTILSALAVCAGSTLSLVLKKMGQPVAGLEVDARGLRRDEHPTVLTEISLQFKLDGAGVDEQAVTRALKIAEEQLCPVWAMLKPGTPITASFELKR